MILLLQVGMEDSSPAEGEERALTQTPQAALGAAPGSEPPPAPATQPGEPS